MIGIYRPTGPFSPNNTDNFDIRLNYTHNNEYCIVYLNEHAFINRNKCFIFGSILHENGETTVVYSCSSCRQIFLSRSGAMEHKCPLIVHDQFGNLYDEGFIYNLMLEWMAVCNISAKAMGHPLLNLILSILGFKKILERHQLSIDLKIFALHIQENILNQLNGHYVSILIDGAKRYWHTFEGVLLFANDRLYYYSLIEIQRASAQTLAQLISLISRNLESHNIHLVSVCSDNASNNKKALNGASGSAQDLSYNHFIRIPCTVHTVNLSITDVVAKRGTTFGWIALTINNIVRAAKEAYITITPVNIRWASLHNSITDIVNKKDLITTRCPTAIPYIQILDTKVGINNLKNSIDILWNLIEILQKDLTSITRVFPVVYDAIQQLESLNTPISKAFSSSLSNRFHTTITLFLPLFGFLITKEGLDAYQKTNYPMQLQMYSNAKKGIYLYLRDTETYSETLFSNICAGFDYFIEFSWPVINYDLFSNPPQALQPFSDFCELAKKVYCMPCSESGVERLFSQLSHLYTVTNKSTTNYTLNARLAIKMNYIFSPTQEIPPMEFPNLISTFEEVFHDSPKILYGEYELTF